MIRNNLVAAIEISRTLRIVVERAAEGDRVFVRYEERHGETWERGRYVIVPGRCLGELAAALVKAENG